MSRYHAWGHSPINHCQIAINFKNNKETATFVYYQAKSLLAPIILDSFYPKVIRFLYSTFSHFQDDGHRKILQISKLRGGRIEKLKT